MLVVFMSLVSRSGVSTKLMVEAVCRPARSPGTCSRGQVFEIVTGIYDCLLPIPASCRGRALGPRQGSPCGLRGSEMGVRLASVGRTWGGTVTPTLGWLLETFQSRTLPPN